MNQRAAGKYWEEQAATYLIQKGYRVLHQNFSCRIGEIDLVAQYRDILVFVEVKARKNNHYGIPAEAVTVHKLQKISRTAEFYMARYSKYGMDARIDVIEILEEGDKPVIRHLENVTG